jgi:hypothetical protein
MNETFVQIMSVTESPGGRTINRKTLLLACQAANELTQGACRSWRIHQ